MIDFKPDKKETVPDLIRRKAQEYGVDPNIALGVAEQESNFNPDARNKKSGATGVMQLMPKTAKGLGVKDSKNPEQNVDAGVRYLSTLHEKHGGDTDKALAEYGGFKKKDPTSYVEGVKEKAQKYVTPKVDFKADKPSGPLGRAAESIVKRSRELAPQVVGDYVGVLEGLATTASGMTAFPLSVAAGVGAMVGQAAKQGNFEVDPEIYSEAQEKVARVLTYQPKTEKGEFQARTLGAPFELLGKAQEKGLEFVPEKYRGEAKIASDIALIAAPFAKSFVLRPIAESNWYRRMTVKERGLVNQAVQEMKREGMSEGDIVQEQWKDSSKREELLKKYAGVQEELKTEPKAERKVEPKEEGPKTPPAREGEEPILKSKWSETEYFDKKLKEGVEDVAPIVVEKAKEEPITPEVITPEKKGLSKEVKEGKTEKPEIPQLTTKEEDVSPTSLSPKEPPVPPAAPLIEVETKVSEVPAEEVPEGKVDLEALAKEAVEEKAPEKIEKVKPSGRMGNALEGMVRFKKTFPNGSSGIVVGKIIDESNPSKIKVQPIDVEEARNKDGELIKARFDLSKWNETEVDIKDVLGSAAPLAGTEGLTSEAQAQILRNKLGLEEKEVEPVKDVKPVTDDLNELRVSLEKKYESDYPKFDDYMEEGKSTYDYQIALREYNQKITQEFESDPRVKGIIDSVAGKWNVIGKSPDGQHIKASNVSYKEGREILHKNGILEEADRDGLFPTGRGTRVVSNDGFVTELRPVDAAAQAEYQKVVDYAKKAYSEEVDISIEKPEVPEKPKPEIPSDWFKQVTEAYSGKKAEELFEKFGKTREDYMLFKANEEVRVPEPEEMTIEQLEGYERTFKGEAWDKDSLLIRRDAAERLGVEAKGKDPEQLKKEVTKKIKELKPKAKSGIEAEEIKEEVPEEVKTSIKEIIANIKPEVPNEVVWDYFDLDGLLKAHGIDKADFIKEEQKLIVSDEVKRAIEKLRLPKKEEGLGEAGFIDLTKLKDVGKDLWDFYRKRPEFTPMKEMIGKYTGGLQVIDLELTKLAKRINEEIPKDKQVAINVYMEAGGDPETLKKYASTVKGDYKKMYEDAQNLSPEERAKADEFRKQFDELWIAAFGEDVIDSYVENYVRHQWKDPEKAGAKTLAGLQAGFFRVNPREAMKRVFQDNYEGIQAGYEPVDMRIGYQFVAWQRSVRQAILARKFLKSLMRSKEVDGRPSVVIGGSGKPIKSEGVDLKKAHFIKANNKGHDTRDFKFIDHPALRRWKWIGETEDGAPIYMEGNMWVHPEAYHRMNAMFGKSAIREFKIPDRVPLLGGKKPGKGALAAGGFVKGTVLVGPFHHVHMAEHALFHKVNPFTTREIEFNERPVLKDLVDHGLMLYNHNALAEFGEGLASGGAWKYVPVVGENQRRYQEWLFTDYIPRLKAEMAEHAVERAKGYYEKQLTSGELSMDQLLENVAMQSNAAFGEQNYKYLGRNPTLQDALRIGLLAPDFLEARLRFGGQAMRPYGKEQTMALLRGAAIMGSAAIVASLLFGDENKWNPNRPFSVVIGGREYTPRSVVGDIAHLISDPRGFWYYRLNPLWGRPVAQLATGRDEKGRKSTPLNVAKDTLKTWVPIPAQGLVKDQGDDVLNAMMHGLLSSVGLSNYEYQTDFGRYSMKLDRPAYPKTEKSTEKSKIVHQLKVDRKEGMKSLREAMKKNVITERDRAETEERAFHPAKFSSKKMTLEELAKGVDSTTLTRQERSDILPVFSGKLNKAWEEGKLTKDDRNRYAEILRKLKERQ